MIYYFWQYYIRKKVNDFFFYIYDSETDTTVPVPVEELAIEDEQELEFIYDDKVRKVWHPNEQEWYFSVYDVVQFLADSNDPKQYIKKMRARDSELDSNWGTICTLVKMPALDGKLRKVQSANIEGLLRIMIHYNILIV